jgi:hypothetical protein
MLRRTLLPVVAGAAALAVPAGGVSPALAATCQPYSATAHDAAASPAGPFVGTADVTIGNVTYSDVPSVTNVLAPLSPAGNSGVLFTTTSHTISLPTGTITTTDDARLIPTQEPEVYRLVTHLVITSGATGELHLQATLNLTTLTADGTFVGTVCGLG